MALLHRDDPVGAAPLVTTAERVEIIVNPAAGGYGRERVGRLVDALASRGARVGVAMSRAPGDIARLAAEVTGDGVVLAVVGGDGTINEAIRGLAGRGAAAPPLAIVPAGTANVLADELDLPRHPEKIATMILGRRTSPLHYGLADGRPFVLMASAGFDAAVVHAVDPGVKRWLKQLAYVAAAFSVGGRASQPDLAVEADGEHLRCRLAVVTNASHYGGPHVLCRQAAATRPGLFLVCLHRDSRYSLLRVAAALLAGRFGPSERVSIRPVTRCVVRAARPVATQIDGEVHAATPLVIEAGTSPLRVVVP